MSNIILSFSTCRQNSFKRRPTRQSDSMKELTAAIVASVVEKHGGQVVPHQQRFLSHEQTSDTKHVLLVS